MSFIRPDLQVRVLAILVVLFYGIVPFILWAAFDMPTYFLTCAGVSFAGAASLYVGLWMARVDGAKMPGKEIRVSDFGLFAILLFFVFYIAITLLTAPSVPILEAISTGSDADVVAASRASFLKARTGWESILVYFNGVLTGSIIPFFLVSAYRWGLTTRHVVLITFFAFSLVSMEKVFFLKVVIPLIAFVSFYVANGERYAKIMVAGSCALVAVNMSLAGFSGGTTNTDLSIASFFSAEFMNEGGDGLQFFLYRSFAVPIFTAVDSFRVFEEKFGGYLLGASNATLSALFGLERVWFERSVFADQFGQSDEGVGSANALYLVEAYVNFGWIGVAIFSIIAGYILARMAASPTVGVRCLAPLLVWGLFNGGLLGTLLGNGFIFLWGYLAVVSTSKPKGSHVSVGKAG